MFTQRMIARSASGEPAVADFGNSQLQRREVENDRFSKRKLARVQPHNPIAAIAITRGGRRKADARRPDPARRAAGQDR